MKKKFLLIPIFFILILTGCIFESDGDLSSQADLEFVKFNDGYLAFDYSDDRVYFPLAEEYNKTDNLEKNLQYKVKVEYSKTGKLYIDEEEIKNGDDFTFQNIVIGSEKEMVFVSSEGEEENYILEFTGLPIVQVFNRTILDNESSPGQFCVTSPNSSENTEQNSIAIQIRGAVSTGFVKKSYGFEIRDSENWQDNEKIKLLDMRKDDDWILDAAYLDRSFMRNRLAHDLFLSIWPDSLQDNSFDGQSTVKGRFVELFLNNKYHGLYILSEKIDRKLLSFNKKASFLFKGYNHKKEGLEKFKMEYPKDNPWNMAAVANAWDELDNYLKFITESSDDEFYGEIENTVDIENLINYQLLLHITAASDNILKNFYLGKDKNGKFQYFPWDLDSSLGRSWTSMKKNPYEWFELVETVRLLNRQQYKDLIKERWFALRQDRFSYSQLVARITAYYELLSSSGAYRRNEVRWPINSDYCDNDKATDDVEYLKQWLLQRLSFVDYKMNNY